MESLLQMQTQGKSTDAYMFIINIIVWWETVNRTQWNQENVLMESDQLSWVVMWDNKHLNVIAKSYWM